MVDDLQLMEAEADIYNSLSRITEHLQRLNEGAHLLNYKSSHDDDVEFRKSFYSLLVKIHESQSSLINLFEAVCQIHNATYKD